MLIDTWNDIVKNEANNTERLVSLFLASRSKAKPSLWGMVKTVFNEIENNVSDTVSLVPLESACTAAEKHSYNAYHNEHHNREVTLLTSLMLIKHLRDGNEAEFTARDARNLLMAAAIHDLNHDGGSNMVDGVHRPLRLEKQSLKSAASLWKGQDVNEEDLLFIYNCVVPTDISSSAEKVSPRSSLEDAFNNASTKQNIYSKNLKLRTAAAMLSDADLGVSGGLTPKMFDINSMILEEETNGAVPATKGSAQYFFNNVLTSFPLSFEGGVLLKIGHNKIKNSVLGA